jgi:hypothetical protein
MLNPLPARIPDTRESTPGSFCTKQLRMCLVAKVKKKVIIIKTKEKERSACQFLVCGYIVRDLGLLFEGL